MTLQELETALGIEKPQEQARIEPLWLTQAHYARHWDTSVRTIIRRTSYLRRIKAVVGKGKAMRYKKTVSPNGEKVVE
jgi:hypothetical protein